MNATPGLASERSITVILIHALTILTTFVGIWVVSCIPHFAVSYRDLLGQHPLPFLTSLVLSLYPILLVLACASAIAAVYLAGRYGCTPPPRLAPVTIIVFAALQAGITAYALFLPLLGIVQGLNATP